MPANTAVPGAPRSRSDRNSSDGLATSRRPAPVISNTPISSVGPKRFLIARRMRNRCAPSPSNDSTASTMCSTTRGSGDLPVLGDVADQDDGGAARLGEADQHLGGAAHLGDRAGRGLRPRCVHMVWIESMTTRRGVLPSRQGCDDVLDRGLGGELDRRRGEAEPFGAQPHLRDRLLAGNIDRAVRRIAPARPRPGSAASTCRCPDRRRPAAPSRGQSRRR